MTHAPACGCFPLLRKKQHPQHSSALEQAAPACIADAQAANPAPLPVKVVLPAQAVPVTPAPKAPIPLESSSPQSDSIPAATGSSSPSSSPPASRLPRSRQPTDEAAASFAPAGNHILIASRTSKLSESEPITITTTRIPTKSASVEETVTVIADATAEATADIVIDVTDPHTPAPRAAPPSKIPTPPASRCASQEMSIIELPPQEISSIAGSTDASADLQKLMQNLPFSISPPGSPTATSSPSGACPSSPVTIVNISVNQFNYHLQPDGTWATQGCQRSTSAPHPNPSSGPIIVEMVPDSKQLSRIPSRPMTPQGLPPTRIPSCPAPARTTSLGGSKIPTKFVAAPPPPKRLTSAPQKLALAYGS